MKAIAYTRVSTEEQVRQGVSIDAQREAVATYCQLRGLELVQVVSEEGVSAGKPLAAREGGRRLIALVEGEKAGAVVATRLDRLFRDAIDCLSVTRQWDAQGVALHLIDMGGQSVDTSSAMGRMFLTFMAGMAEMERGLIGERTREAYRHKHAKGERWGQIPYGQRLADDGVTLVPDELEQAALKDLHLDRSAGMSIRQVTSRLNSFHPLACRGQRWHKTTVARLINRLEAEDSG